MRSEGHWRDGYSVSHVSHPAVSSDHTLSGPGSVSWMSACVPACVCLFFSRADHLEEMHPAATTLNQRITCEAITPATSLKKPPFELQFFGPLHNGQMSKKKVNAK